MATFLRKALRTRSLITQLTKSPPQISGAAAPPPLSVQNPIFVKPKAEDSSLRFYPSFCFEHFINPISQTGGFLVPSEDVGGESQGIWADSVKKKRKRKMNKHKLKKLRKRLRRKT